MEGVLRRDHPSEEPRARGPVGSRVALRAPRRADAAAFVAAVAADPAFYGPWAEPPTTRAAFLAYLDRVAGPSAEGFLVVRRDDDALVGRATLSQIFHGGFQSAYLGYEALPGHARRGYMVEGVGLVLQHAFGRLGLHRVEANVQPGNAPSLALVRRLGFRREGFSPKYLRIAGEWRDHERWALLADEFRAPAGG
jgi:ribosomal-protein-alanine N-acetyltransferase